MLPISSTPQTMPTLIFTPRFTDDSQALWKAAGELGWTTERLGGWRVPQHLRSLPDPVLYGEALFGPALAEQLGIELLSPPEDWLVRLPQEHRKRVITLSTLGAERGRADAAFIKPPNDKSFPAGVYRGADLPAGYAEDMPVLVSEVVQWEMEFRCFVLDRRLCTYSLYSRHGELQRDAGFNSDEAEDRELEAFVGALLADPRVELPRAIVVDAGYITGAGWACVELNAAWGAGIYGCDPTAALRVIEQASVTSLSVS
jgi:hypothetical protein